MRKKCTRTLSLLIVIVFIALSPSMAAEIPVVRGQRYPPAHGLIQGLFVVVEDVSTHREITQVDVCGNDTFELRDVSPGDYALRVTDSFGRTICQQFVTINNQMPPLEVRLPERESHGAGAGAVTVSVSN